MCWLSEKQFSDALVIRLLFWCPSNITLPQVHMQLKFYQFILIIIWAINKPKPRFQKLKKIFYPVRSCISQFTLTITWLVSDLPWRLLSSPCILRSKQSSSVTIPQPFTCDGRHGSWLQPSCTPILLTELRVRKKMSSCIGFHHSILTRSVSLRTWYPFTQ